MQISIEEISKSFTNHLNISNNEKIIFSGRFGIGKSFFLKNYFEESMENFASITISPVNYSVASNKDIFEYIKYDILFELLKEGVVDDKSNFTNLEKTFNLLQSVDRKVFGRFLEMIPQVGKDLNNIIEGIEELYNHFNKFSNYDNENSQVTKYLKSHTQELGNIYEENFITTLINELIEKLLSGREKTVLIIEDLDRLDPDHIFRILNIFSVHTDFQSGRFKFDFNIFILVCDIRNIQNIYRHRYGSDVDFEGYMDKFYSHKIFNFTNSSSVKREIKSILNKSIDINVQPDHDFIDIYWLTEILFILTDCDFVTVRKLSQLLNFGYKAKENRLLFNNRITIRNQTFLRVLKSPNIINFLSTLFGNLDELIVVIQAIKNSKIYFDENHDYKAMVSDLLSFYNYNKHLDHLRDQNFTLIYSYKEYKLEINYVIAEFPFPKKFVVEKLNIKIENVEHPEFNINQYPDLFYHLLYETLLKVKNESVLNLIND